MDKLLVFQTKISKDKPRTVTDNKSYCPFCDSEQLIPAIIWDEDICILPNKFPIFAKSKPYVLVETNDCNGEMADYTLDRMVRVIKMGFDFWQELIKSKEYMSVAFFKNCGPMSGGSLRHPHMQIMGLFDVDCMKDISLDKFAGPVIKKTDGAVFNISANPMIGFVELNIELTDKDKGFIDFCSMIQNAIKYMTKIYRNGQFTSYNLFFYEISGRIFCKYFIRNVTTPLFVGYAVPQVSDNIQNIANDIKNMYYGED